MQETATSNATEEIMHTRTSASDSGGLGLVGLAHYRDRGGSAARGGGDKHYREEQTQGERPPSATVEPTGLAKGGIYMPIA
jgi:hypothetical protein